MRAMSRGDPLLRSSHEGSPIPVPCQLLSMRHLWTRVTERRPIWDARGQPLL